MLNFRYQKENLRKFILEKKAVTSIEFAILFLPFFTIIIILIESLILSYQVSIVDFLVNEGAKYSSSYSKEEDNEKKFETYIKKYEDYFFSFINKDNLKLSLKYCKDIKELEDNNCGNNSQEYKIIIYTLKYKINPIFVSLRLVNQEEFISRSAFYYTEKKKEL